MKHILRYSYVLTILMILMAKVAIGSNGENSKDLPPDWGYNPTGGSHLIAITTNVIFNCVNLSQGDYVGLFYTNNQGGLSCGGALAWAPGQSQVIAAYADDITTLNVKDGFAENEPLIWKVYYQQTGTEQFILVSYNTSMTNFNGLFQTNGVSALVSILNPISLTINALPLASCAGDPVQLSAVVTGGCGTPVYTWTSNPAGFTSNEADPVAYPLVSTTYTVVVTNQYGDSKTASVSVTVNPLPVVACPQSLSACVDAMPVLLNTATPEGGVYSGTGVFANNGSYYFDPSVGTGNYIITYCLIDLATGCENCCEFTFTVNPLPEVACPDDFTVCIYAEPFSLTGATPEGGVYSGTGVAGGIFNPSTAGAGEHLITYTYTHPQTGCASSCEFSITVIEVDVECPSDFALCVDADPVTLSGGLPVGGVYTGSGVTAGIFYPSVAGAGLHLLTYTWVYPGTNCFATCEFAVEVYPLPQLSCPETIEVCLASEDLLLNEAMPQGGVYTGTGVQFSNGVYYFEPWIGTGEYTITYCYTDPTTGCADCCEFLINVVADQVIDIPEGWSGISSYINPSDPDLGNLLYPITYPLIILNNFSGVYWPGGNTFTLENWDPYSGYVIKSSWDTQLPVCGNEVQNKTINLNQGWNLMPVLSTENISIVDLFAGVAGFQIAKEVAGTGIYWPEYGINTIGAVKPGKAYYVKMTAAGSVDF